MKGRAGNSVIALLLCGVVALCPSSRAYAEWGSGETTLLADIYNTLVGSIHASQGLIYYDVDGMYYQLTSDQADGRTTVRGYLAQIASNYTDMSQAFADIATIRQMVGVISDNVLNVKGDTNSIRYTLSDIKDQFTNVTFNNAPTIRAFLDATGQNVATIKDNITNGSAKAAVSLSDTLVYSSLSQAPENYGNAYGLPYYVGWIYKKLVTGGIGVNATSMDAISSVSLGDAPTNGNTLYKSIYWLGWIYKKLAAGGIGVKANLSDTLVYSSLSQAPENYGNAYGLLYYVGWIYKKLNTGVKIANPGSGGGEAADLSSIENILNNMTFANYEGVKRLNVIDVYANGMLANIETEVEGVNRNLGDVKTLLAQLNAKSAVPDNQVIGELNWGDYKQKSDFILETASELAPFGAITLVSEIVAVVASVDELDSPRMDFDFKFGGFEGLKVTIDLSWLDDVKPMINFGLITLLIVGLTMVMFEQTRLEAVG